MYNIDITIKKKICKVKAVAIKELPHVICKNTIQVIYMHNRLSAKGVMGRFIRK